MTKMKMRAKEMVGELEDDGDTSETMETLGDDGGTSETMEARLETMETLGDDGDETGDDGDTRR